jgi:hypothetical protein
MLSRAAECARLSLIIERWLDADLLLVEEGETLLAEITATHRALEGGDVEAIHRHTRQFLLAVEALVGSGRLGEGHRCPALAAARGLLEAAAG